jgi:hypothetical protein
MGRSKHIECVAVSSGNESIANILLSWSCALGSIDSIFGLSRSCTIYSTKTVRITSTRLLLMALELHLELVLERRVEEHGAELRTHQREAP